ncbi:MAG: hypothetical protein KatS3mg105_2022 [Gemmatales bacterium]|nr:MAG: hypothetical protein KatS3mg105_2022 [Gemmatales bacterium]
MVFSRRGRSLDKHWQLVFAAATIAWLVVVTAAAPQQIAQPVLAPRYPPAAANARSASPAYRPGHTSTTASARSPLDDPLRLLAEAGRSYQNVRDYTCRLIKQERINGKLQPLNLINLKMRTQPFSVSMQWVAPKHMAGQEVVYVDGWYDGMMRVHPAGMLRFVNFVSVHPDDPRTKSESRHNIREAGIGHLISHFHRRWTTERQLQRTQVRIADYNYANRTCTRVETIHKDSAGGLIPDHRNVVYFDKQTRLPIRVECYDWPKRGGTPGGELLETYSYVDLQFNVGLRDDIFRR